MISNQKMKGIVKAEKIDNDGMNEEMRHELDVMENDGIKPKLDLEVEFDKDGMNEEMRQELSSSATWCFDALVHWCSGAFYLT